MTGTGRSTSASWQRGAHLSQPTGPPHPTFVLPLCGSPLRDNTHPQNLVAGRRSPSYFGIPVMRSGFAKDWDPPSTQSPTSSPRIHVVPQSTSLGDYLDLSAETPELDRGGTQARRCEFISHDSLPQLSSSKSLPYCPGEPARNHKMTVFWPGGEASEVHEDHTASKLHVPLANPHTYLASTGIVPQRIGNASAPDLMGQSGTMISTVRCAELIQSSLRVMLLDIRPLTHFNQATIKGSLNLCVPTTLLKRRSFDIRKLEATFTDEAEKKSFAQWMRCRYIIVYDAATTHKKDAASLLQMLSKFTIEGWAGEGVIISGGFKAFAADFPNMVRSRQSEGPSQAAQLSSGLPSVAPVIGGCTLPESSTAALPLFSSIRQSMLLHEDTVHVAVKLPKQLTESRRELLPYWLRIASDPRDKGRQISKKFSELERREMERMREAFSYDKESEPIGSEPSKRFRIAGIEKGAKNRYNDIYPFEHSRVRLQNVPAGDCDYVNANYIKAANSSKRYIATQAPVPGTFDDFWRVIWEQNVRVIVSLTAEMERGQVKCHPYWNTGDYGHLRVRALTLRHIRLSPGTQYSPSMQDPPPDVGTDHNIHEDEPCIVIRHFSLSHIAAPFHPLREVTQLQYPCWPDFGTTAQPSHLVELIEQCNRAAETLGAVASESASPILVHCSAGCGRTGTFCTVDSVLDMMKRKNGTEIQIFGALEETLDPIVQTVEDFRMQRPSMVQNLSQFVLCYESILEWMTTQMIDISDD